MKHKKRKKKFDLGNDPSYQKLVSDIKAIIKDAAVKGVDLRKRQDCLQCNVCGAYENGEPQGEGTVWVYDKNNQELANQPFIIIDKRERTYRRNKMFYSKMTYTFICSVCGRYQTKIVRDKFPDED